MKRVLSLLWVLCWFHLSFTQVVSTTHAQKNEALTIPQESVYVHYNTSLIFAGDYFYYSLYCFASDTQDLSTLSKIAYVELVGEDGQRIFRQKINLEEGRGYGDAFIPVSAVSGTYKLLAYTNWMRNSTSISSYTTTIHIINPYQTQSSMQQKGEKSEADALDFTDDVRIPTPTQVAPLAYLELPKDQFSKRSLISLNLKPIDASQDLSGSFSVSVRRKSSIPRPVLISLDRFLKELPPTEKSAIADKSSLFLPELRGELLQGKVLDKERKTPVSSVKVAVSIPGENPVFKIVNTNEQGLFFLNVEKNYAGKTAYFQVLGDRTDAYQISVQEPSEMDISGLSFSKWVIDPSWRDEILTQSIHNQIENAYFEFKPDSIKPKPSLGLFKDKEVIIYKLDDYARFPTLRQTIVEIVKNVSIRKTDANSAVFAVQGFEFGTNTGIRPLVFVDGIAVQDHEALMNFDATLIKEIRVYRDQFVFGLEVFQGVISMETSLGNTDVTLLDPLLYKTSLFRPEPRKRYYKQTYSAQSLASRIPDDRQQLLWIPEWKVDTQNRHIEFFSSDVAGTYEVRLEGVTNKGIPLSVSSTFKVE